MLKSDPEHPPTANFSGPILFELCHYPKLELFGQHHHGKFTLTFYLSTKASKMQKLGLAKEFLAFPFKVFESREARGKKHPSTLDLHPT